MNKKNIKIVFIIIVLFALVIVSFDSVNAQVRRGVMGCNAAGFGSVGSRTPSGAHVPVWDYAVSLNTNILVYKECILDGVVNGFRQAALSKIIQTGLTTINEGFDGSPMFVEDINTHFRERVLDPRAKQIYSGEETNNISAPFKQEVRTALQMSYEQRRNKPYESYTCPIEPSKVQACLDGDMQGCGGLQGFYDFTSNPSCNPLFAYYEAQQYFDNALGAEAGREKMELNWGRGFRSAKQEQTITLADGSTTKVNRIVTPGYLISKYASQILGTGLRQMENADEIDEIIGLLMSNLGTKVLTDDKGLAGIKPYLANVVDEAYYGARDGLVTLTLNSLSSAITNENTILESLQEAAKAITKAKTDIRATDLQCLEKVVIEAERGTKNQLCISSMGTTTGCSVTVSRTYDYSKVETFESSMQRVSMSGYARDSGTVSTKYTTGGGTKGKSDTTTGGTYNKYTSSGQGLASLLEAAKKIISPYATETSSGSTYTTLGDFNFTGQLLNGEPVYKFGYDLPDVTVTATSSTTTIPAINTVIDLKKNHSELVIESENPGMVGYTTLATLYGYIGSTKATIKNLENAKKKLQKERSKKAINAAESILDKARTDVTAFTFAEEMKSKIASIKALSGNVSSCWTDSDGKGCGSPRWCIDDRIKTDWRNYIK